MQTVVETPSFLADAKSAGVSAAERAAIIDLFAREPNSGALIQESGGARKSRIAGRG